MKWCDEEYGMCVGFRSFYVYVFVSVKDRIHTSVL